MQLIPSAEIFAGESSPPPPLMKQHCEDEISKLCVKSTSLYYIIILYYVIYIIYNILVESINVKDIKKRWYEYVDLILGRLYAEELTVRVDQPHQPWFRQNRFTEL